MILYRPVGLQEVELIYDSGMTAFPARLPQQPIFYPVLQLEYARQIASDWNVKNGQLGGYVTQFKVEDEYVSRFETHAVGGSQHQELWTPAEEMEEFNRHITGHIKVVEAYFGKAFKGFIPERFGLQGKNAVDQFTELANSFVYKRMDFYLEIKRNHKAVFLNYPFWQTYAFKNPGLKEKVLQAIREAWLTSFPKIPLPVQAAPSTINQIDSRTPHLVDPDQDEIVPLEETDSDPWAEPMEQESSFEEETDVQPNSLVNPVPEEIKPVQQTRPKVHVQRFTNPVQKSSAPARQAPPQALRNPVHEEIMPEDESDSDHLVERDDDETTPDSALSVSPVPEELTPVEQIEAPVFVKPIPPTKTDSHVVRGIRLGLEGKYREAIGELSKAVAENPDDVVAYTSLGVAFHHLGEEDRALACYESALEIDPKYAEAHYFRANLLYGLGDVREAIAGYTTAIGLRPELIQAQEEPAPEDRLTDYSPTPAEIFRIARLAHRILDLNKALETHPGQATLFKERASAYERLGNYEQAIADYSSFLALQPEDASAFYARGVAYEQLGQHDQAREDYEKAVSIDPRLSGDSIARGVTFGTMGNLRQSIASLSQGIRLDPQNPDAYFNRGTAYFQQGDFARAIEDFSNVIRLSPGDEAAYYWRGISHEEAGREEEAIADYRQFLAISQDSQARKEVEQKLSRWNKGKRNNVTGRMTVPEDVQKADRGEPEKPDRALDLSDLIIALGERALDSTWVGSGVECYGESAEELVSFTEDNRPLEGQEFLRLTAGIHQTVKGDFIAFDSDSTSHWIFLRAWEGIGFYVETNDPKSEKRLKTQFPAAEEVEGAPPPYEGLFIRI